MLFTKLKMIKMKQFKKNFAILFFITFFSYSQDFSSAVDYLNYINKIEEPISKDMWKYTKTVAHSKSARRIDNVRKNLIKTIQTAKNNLKKNTKGFNNDLEFHNKVIDYLTFSELMINEEYAKIIDMQEVAEQSYDFMEAYITTRELVNDKMNEEHEKLLASQSDFAKKYNVNLISSDEGTDIEKKMKLSSQVFKYHSNLYLLFFKCNYTDILLDNAIKSKDLAAIQQNANALKQYAEEGIAKIKEYEPIKGDNTLANQTKKSLEMYLNQANTFVPKVVDFYTYNSQFEDLSSALERKSPKERTKEEIDNYNKMVKEINKKINEFNKLNTENVNLKNKEINQWNTTAEQYISKHIPND